MNKSGSEARVTHRKVQSSTTLNRKYVKAPTTRISADKIAQDYHAERQLRRQAIAEQMNREAAMRVAKNRQKTAPAITKETKASTTTQTAAPTLSKVKITATTQTITPAPSKPKTPILAQSIAPTPSELKNQAIAKALKNAAAVEKAQKPKFGLGRIILALSCSAVFVFAIVYFINLNIPDFSLRVAAMQTGIEATYPNYIPRGFLLKGITSENNKIAINFSNADGKSFTLTEEKSSWDSATLLNNYVKNNYSDYTTIREQGLTIYITSSQASWVSGGIVYEITSDANLLSKKQIKSIAVSL